MKSADSIKAKLNVIAIAGGKPFDYVLMHYFIERMLYRLSVSNYVETFILKGGLLLYTILDNDARATRDIDFLARHMNNSPEKLKKVFAEIADIPSDDAVSFDSSSITVERIKEDADYQGVRIKLTGFLDRSRHVLQFDIGFGDIIVPKPVEMEYPSLLDMDQPHLKVYSMESVIAEKFHAMIYLAEANSRMKDFYDIYKLCHLFDFDGGILLEAISQTFKHRATIVVPAPTIFSESFPTLTDKQRQWQAFQKRIGVGNDLEFQVALADIKTFLFPIYNGVQKEEAFSGKWRCATTTWEKTNLSNES